MLTLHDDNHTRIRSEDVIAVQKPMLKNDLLLHLRNGATITCTYNDYEAARKRDCWPCPCDYKRMDADIRLLSSEESPCT